MFNYQQRNAPLRRTVDIDDVGKSALYLLSDLSSGVTGEIHYVDCGYNMSDANCRGIEETRRLEVRRSI